MPDTVEQTVPSIQGHPAFADAEPAPIPAPLSGRSLEDEPVELTDSFEADQVEDEVEDVPTPVAAEKPQEIVEKIVPQVDPVERTLTYEGVDRVYTQRPLSYFGKISFFGLVGETFEEILDGPDGVNLDSIFGDVAPNSVDDFRASELGELSTFVSAVAKIARYAPDFVKDAYLIILNVPHNEKAFAREALDSIDDDTGEDILVTFIDQNVKELESFFTERLPKILGRAQNLRSQD